MCYGPFSPKKLARRLVACHKYSQKILQFLEISPQIDYENVTTQNVTLL